MAAAHSTISTLIMMRELFRYRIISWKMWPLNIGIQKWPDFCWCFSIVHIRRTETKHSAMRFKYYWRNSSLAVIILTSVILIMHMSIKLP